MQQHMNAEALRPGMTIQDGEHPFPIDRVDVSKTEIVVLYSNGRRIVTYVGADMVVIGYFNPEPSDNATV